jgi:isoleucyl-tRNA synthetase
MTAETPLDLKSTLNLTRTDFPQKANLGQREPERLAKWREMDLYHEVLRARSGLPMFILHDGPPYANSDIHIGTAVNKILKDFVVKSHSMMGYNSPYVPGYDCHGLPIELHVDKQLGAKKAQMDPVEFRRVCRDYAANALGRQTRDFKRLGVFGEWDHPYTTMSNQYEAQIARILGRFVEQGYVYKGARPVYWCIKDQTALADHEVEYKDHTSPSIYVKFPLPAGQVQELNKRIAAREPDPISATADLLSPGSKPVYVLIWTTTPWTLPANIGITVHPSFSYSAVDFGGEVYIVASDLVEAIAESCGLDAPRVIVEFQGELLEGLRARHAWLDRPSLLMTGTFVTLGGEADAETELEVRDQQRKGTGKSGTGCVHTAPGHGHDDFVIGQQYRVALQPIYDEMRRAGMMPGVEQNGVLRGIATESADATDVYCPVSNDGRFTDDVEHFRGMQVFQANRPIVDFMRESGALLFTEDYTHRYPHCWRCKNPVIFRATSQWFISMDAKEAGAKSLRQGALDETDITTWVPAWGRERMRSMLAKRPDWCVSRQRLWGVPIPAFYCRGCKRVLITADLINHVAAIFETDSADAWYSRPASELLPDGFVCPGCGGSGFDKETDILDVWFDAGSSSIAALEYEYRLPWPADVYLEGGDQYRGWFNSSLIVGLAVHGKAPFKTVVTHGWTVDGEGRAMHKSTGNAVSPNKVMESSGAEILRLWVASSDFNDDMRVSDEILKRQVDAYRKLRNTARFALGNIYDFDPAVDSVPEPEMLEIDRWALAATREVIARVVQAYKRFDYTGVYHAIYNNATVTLSAIYFDILKDRLYTFAPRSEGRRSAQTALCRIGEVLALLLSPILPFTADEIWEHLPGERQKSVHLATFPEALPQTTDVALIKRWDRILEVRSLVQKALEEKRAAKEIGGSLEAKVIIHAGREEYEFLEQYRDQWPAILITSQADLRIEDKDGIWIEVEHASGEKCERCWNWSETVGCDSRYPTLDSRCIQQMEAGWGAANLV